MNPHAVLDEAKAIIGERGRDYGDVEDNFSAIATIFNATASAQSVDAHDVAMLMVALKLARTKESPKKRDNYLDAINYLAFACELIGAE